MSPRTTLFVAAFVLAAGATSFAQDLFEPNPSLAELSADDAYARTSARSLKSAGIDTPVAFHLYDEGQVLVVGERAWEFPRIARLEADGRLDASFGNGGVAEIPVWGTSGLGIEVDASGRIVVAGPLYEAHTFPQDPELAGAVYGAVRLRSSGSLDPDFSGDGLLELDGAAGLGVVGPVRASGSDGALLAVAARRGPEYESPVGPRYDMISGVVRIAADGTLDATYGGGFAQIAQGPWADYFSSRVDYITDLAVDSTGRAVVAVKDVSGYGFTVQRLDASGGIDPTFWSADYLLSYPFSYPNFTATRIALDGAARIVGLDGEQLLRRLPDGAPDSMFSADGFAWGLEIAGFPGSLRAYYTLQSYMRMDPDYDPLPETAFLAVATRADRWVLARNASYRDARGRSRGGIRVQTIDPADPGAIVSTVARAPGQRFTGVRDVAITPDGATAYLLGTQSVLRIELSSRRALPLPDLRVKWLGWPHAIEYGGSRYRVTAKVRIRNVSRHDATAAYGFVGLGDGVEEFPLVGPVSNGSDYAWPFRVPARSSVVKRIVWEGRSGPIGLVGARLSVRVACELPDANLADNTATSRTISPLYVGKR